MATTIDWESTLPKYVEQGTYSEANIDNILATDMNEGPYKTRQRSTEAYQALSCSMIITSAQRETFYTFYKSTIGFGALSFNFPQPDDPLLSTVEAKLSSFTCKPINGSQWRLTMSLVVLITE